MTAPAPRTERRVRETLAGHARGWSYTPLDGKRPTLPAWQRAPREDATEAEAWARRGNVGLRTGSASGIVVVDVDERKGGRTPEGLPTTVTVRTGGGGLHLYFLNPDGGLPNSVGKLAPHVDVRGERAQAVAVGSIHPETGDAYEWAPGKAPDEIAVAHLPEEVIARLRPRAAGELGTRRPTTGTAGSPFGVGALESEASRVAGTAEGARNHALNTAAFRMGQLLAVGDLHDEGLVSDVLGRAARAAGLSDREIGPTIASGLAAGRSSPRGSTAPRGIRPPRASGHVRDVLIPGVHPTPKGPPDEVGTDDFGDAVLCALPEGSLYRMGDGGSAVVGTLVGEPGGLSFDPCGLDRLRQIVDSGARLMRRRRAITVAGTAPALIESYVACTRDLAGLVLERARTSRRVRELRLLARHPVYLPGFTSARPGWNAQGCVFYDEPAHLRGLVPNATRALDVLGDLIVDFPLKDEASRQNVFAYMLTRVLRPAIAGATPFFLVMASLARTGKGKLIDVVNLATAGVPPAPMQVGSREEEREKRITTLIRSGATAAHFDNLALGEELDSAAIASLATSWPNWSGRVLGESTALVLPNNLVVAMSANNPRVSGEIAKRIVPITLESKTDKPELRVGFTHPDCHAYAVERQRAVLEALLGMIEAWKAAGQPLGSRPLGGFERWVTTVGGVLTCAGAHSFLDNFRAWVSSANDFQADAEAFVAEWDRRHGDAPIMARQAFQLAEATSVFAALTNARTDLGRLVAFSKRVLGELIDRPVAGRVVRRVGSGSTSLYHLARSAS